MRRLSVLRVHSVYIITNDGRAAFSEIFSDIAPPIDLVSAMFIAMQSFVQEVTGNYFSKLSAGPFLFVSERAGEFFIVMVSNQSDEALDKIKQIGVTFLKRYKSKIDNWKGDTKDFESFKANVIEILGLSEVEETRVDPKNTLTSQTLLTLPTDEARVAREMLKVRECDIEELSIMMGEKPIKLIPVIQQLLRKGIIGQENKAGKIHYFIS